MVTLVDKRPSTSASSSQMIGSGGVVRVLTIAGGMRIQLMIIVCAILTLLQISIYSKNHFSLSSFWEGLRTGSNFNNTRSENAFESAVVQNIGNSNNPSILSQEQKQKQMNLQQQLFEHDQLQGQRSRGLLSFGNCTSSIVTASALFRAIAEVPKTPTARPTLIEICTERIAVSETYVTDPSMDGGSFIGDRFAFDVSSKNIILKCGILSKIDPNGRCIIEALNGTGLFYAVDAKLKLSGFNLMNGGSLLHNGGGAIQMIRSNVEIEDTAFTNNTGITGGAIFSIGINATIRSTLRIDGTTTIRRRNNANNVEFINNKAWSGGAMDTSSTILDGRNILFQDNVASRFGGAVCFYCESSSLVSNSIFINNYVSGEGGVAYASNNGEATFVNTTFRNNAAQIHSAVMDVGGTYKVTMTDCLLLNNTVNVTRDVLDDDDDVLNDGLDDSDTNSQFQISQISTNGTVSSSPIGLITHKVHAAAIRSYSDVAITFVNTTFLNNTRAPSNRRANVFIWQNKTATCVRCTFCDGRGIITPRRKDALKATNCFNRTNGIVIPIGIKPCDIIL